MTTETMTLNKCISDAREAVIEAAEYAKDEISGYSRSRLEDWLSDALHEAVDGAVPIYYSDIFAVLADPRAFSQDINELGGATDDMSKNAQYAIYMAIEEALNEDRSLMDEIDAIANPDEADDEA